MESTDEVQKYNINVDHSLAKEVHTSATGTATDGIVLTIDTNGRPINRRWILFPIWRHISQGRIHRRTTCVKTSYRI